MAGSYVPRIYGGPPGSPDDECCLTLAGTIRVFHSQALRTKPDSDSIRIRMRRFLFLRWLELDGAASIVCSPGEGHTCKAPTP